MSVLTLHGSVRGRRTAGWWRGAAKPREGRGVRAVVGGWLDGTAHQLIATAAVTTCWLSCLPGKVPIPHETTRMAAAHADAEACLGLCGAAPRLVLVVNVGCGGWRRRYAIGSIGFSTG